MRGDVCLQKIDCPTNRRQIARTHCKDSAGTGQHNIATVLAQRRYVGALTQASDRFLLPGDSYNYLGYKTAARKTISRSRTFLPLLTLPSLTLGSFDVKAVGSRTKWAGNLSTTSLFSWSMMFTIFLSRRINIFCVQMPEVFSMARSLRIPSAGYTRSFSGETVKVARCSSR